MGAISVNKGLQKVGRTILKKNLGGVVHTTKQLNRDVKRHVIPMVNDVYNAKQRLVREVKDNPMVYEIAKTAYDFSPNAVQKGISLANRGINLAKSSADQYDKTKKDILRTNKLLRDVSKI